MAYHRHFGTFAGCSVVALGHFGVIVASLWGDFGVMWGALRAYGGAIGSPWGYFGATLPPLWERCGGTFGL